MAPEGPLREVLALLPTVVVAVELSHVLPLADRVRRLLSTSRKSLSVIRSRAVSEHWKEKVLVCYARRTLLLSVEGLLYMMLLLLASVLVFFLCGMILYESLSESAEVLYQPASLVEAMALGALYAFLRKRTKVRRTGRASGYSFLSRAFHHAALGSRTAKEVAFDVDCMLTRAGGRVAEEANPVYVAGLARAGTTIMLEALHATGIFASLTYRDMPFATAPCLWGRLSAAFRHEREKRERAHGDGVQVNYDSPEAFEEAFWLTFAQDEYVRGDRLLPHRPDGELIRKYRRYVGNVVSSRRVAQPLRYLAKNNNLLLRVPAVTSAFPEAKIIVPFRDPVQHAMSLLRQHERFSARHAHDPFSLRYMNWLGHFEFGNNFKPFAFAPEALPEGPGELGKPGYWLRYWLVVHEYLLAHHTSDVIFVDYEELCGNPSQTFRRLEGMLSMAESSLERYTGNIRPPARHNLPGELDPGLMKRVSNAYGILRSHAARIRS